MRGTSKKSSRLGQWTGPQSPSDGRVSWLTTLCQRDVLFKVGVVYITTLVLTGLAYSWGWPLPYRIGEKWAHDVRARVAFSGIDEAKTEKAQEEAIGKLPPDQRSDPAARARAIASVPPEMEH